MIGSKQLCQSIYIRCDTQDVTVFSNLLKCIWVLVRDILNQVKLTLFVSGIQNIILKLTADNRLYIIFYALLMKVDGTRKRAHISNSTRFPAVLLTLFCELIVLAEALL